jgi:large repetitive protein
MATCSFTVIVNDAVPPSIIGCPSDITVSGGGSCQSVVNWTVPTVTDNCPGTVTLTADHNPGDAFPAGTTTVTYTATDGAGNTATCSFTVTVTDAAPPVISRCPSDIIVPAGASCGAAARWTPPTATDNCTASVNITGDHSPGDVFPVGTTRVTYVATDGAGNTATCSFTVTVHDATAPVMNNCPSDITVSIGASCETPVTWTAPTATDNCDPSVTLTGDHNPGEAFPVGSTMVKYTATDRNGNVSTCGFTVTVIDDARPVVSNCPSIIDAITDASGQVSVSWVKPTAALPCGEVALTGSHQPGEVFWLGETEVEYRAAGGTGTDNAVCVFKVIVSYAEIEFDIARVITPDGDGINDQWTLANIGKFKDNRVVIVDRWGSVVYTATGYNNENVVWRGMNTSGGVVPTGTYFYTISVRLGSSVVERRGFIELIR